MTNIVPIAPAVAISTLPSPAQFRTWTDEALSALQLAPAVVARDLDLGKNALSQFLSDPDRDIRLGNAAKIHANLTARARAAGIALPPVTTA
ncbi:MULTISPECIES: hypothetical protein [unclassified Sulfitobacter]|uniref:hypothetical protein n=1 Tax=unclassified Sulfitobacter TaxID=196795 RepID=UPI0023E23A4B|nr:MULTISPECIES: hypothetical protein [unclassified Sulfitobacter]MDF3383343.1 hypothetical protein [Sulfitobacter sp. Ks11]MDF3386762.1 hypothetical protein [Sulfitobacter sp. M85]MDF3390181.1 hypothetical protein [Sulfitobacter sp. Ks16]MDF3400818.1 hypothetical protein [Sulfitobacter sp. KE39]MDF3404239.1 hypothetical protein [Sulfitobacter sp. Ks35]